MNSSESVFVQSMQAELARIMDAQAKLSAASAAIEGVLRLYSNGNETVKEAPKKLPAAPMPTRKQTEKSLAIDKVIDCAIGVIKRKGGQASTTEIYAEVERREICSMASLYAYLSNEAGKPRGRIKRIMTGTYAIRDTTAHPIPPRDLKEIERVLEEARKKRDGGVPAITPET
jgi:hypothetical protein